MTEAELLQELALAMRSADDDGLSVAQLKTQMRRSSEYVRNLIRTGLAAGKLKRGFRYMETIGGRMTPIAVFSYVGKSAPKAKRARARS